MPPFQLALDHCLYHSQQTYQKRTIVNCAERKTHRDTDTDHKRDTEQTDGSDTVINKKEQMLVKIKERRHSLCVRAYVCICHQDLLSEQLAADATP